MKCPECQTENEEGRRFCGQCGAKLGWKCPTCGFVNGPQDRFCGGCGERLGEAPAMGKIPHTPEEMGKIPHTPVVAPPKLEDMHAQLQSYIPKSLSDKIYAAGQEAKGENRLVTTLFADISGFTPVSEQISPEQVADLVNNCFKVLVDIICRYEGSINRFIGDCVLAFFGAPIAHENDPERAVRAALEMCEEITRLNRDISVGINTGMMYVGPIGTDLYMEYTAEGHAVNLAKRLQETAEPGQILVGDATHKFTRRMFDFEPMEPLTVRGIRQPVRAYSVLKVAERPEKLRGIEGLRARLVGRDREFEMLTECADALIDGRGQIVSIIGEAGIGKSRLASELKGYIKSLSENRRLSGAKPVSKPGFRIDSESKDIRWFEGRCISIGQSISYWPFLDILRTYLELSDEDSEEDIARKIVSRMEMLFGKQAGEVIPFIGNLIPVKLDEEQERKLRYLEPEELRHQTLWRLKDVFVALAREKPLLLILEDLHWADDLSLDLLWLLMEELPMAPLMLLCVYRPDREHRSWQIANVASSKYLERYIEITLRPLSQRESRELIESLLWVENLPSSVKESILQKAEGNPFFVEEVVRSLIDGDVIYREADRWRARSEITEVDVPDTIQSVILSRIDRLEDEVKYALQCASVIGRIFRYRLLGYLSQQERQLDGHLAKLEDRELVYEERVVPELEYAFKHALTHETTYSGILARRRIEFHRRVGEGIEALYHERLDEYYEELAYHYSLSDDLEKAVRYLVKAGDKAKEIYANTEALGYYNHALKVLEELPDASSRGMGDFPHMPEERKSIYKGIGHIYGMIGRDDEVPDLLKKALEYCEDRVERAAIKGEIGYSYTYSTEDKSDLAWEYLNAAIKELGEDTQSVEMARMLARLGYFYMECKGEPEKTVECCLRSLKILEETEDYKEISWTYWCLGLGYGEIGDIDEAIEFLHKSLEVSEKAGALRGIANACNLLSRAYTFTGDVDTALEYAHRSLDMCKKIEYSYIGFFVCYKLSRLYTSRSEWDTAAKYCREGLDWAIELNMIGYMGLYYNQLEKICERRGEISKISEEYEKGFAAVKEKLRLEPDNPAVLNIAAWYCVKMEAELEEALAYAQKAVQLSHSSQNLGTLGWVYLKLGQFEEALEQLRGALLLRPRWWASVTAWGGLSEVASSDVDAEIFLRFYRGMMEEVSEDADMKERLHAAMAQFHLKRGSLEDAMSEFARTGCPWNSSWMVIGPFDNTNNAAIEREYPPETEKEIDLDAAYQGKEGEVRWIEFEAEHVSVEVNFNDIFASDGWSVAYALIYVISPADREAQLKVTEAYPSIRVWLNDDVVFDKNPFVRTPKENVVPISLQEGRNKILAKICQACGEIPGWRLYLRITDSEGKSFDDLKYVSASESIM